MTKFDIRCDEPLTNNEIMPRSCALIAPLKKGRLITSATSAAKAGTT
jgi:hypothetical protein